MHWLLAPSNSLARDKTLIFKQGRLFMNKVKPQSHWFSTSQSLSHGLSIHALTCMLFNQFSQKLFWAGIGHWIAVLNTFGLTNLIKLCIRRHEVVFFYYTVLQDPYLCMECHDFRDMIPSVSQHSYNHGHDTIILWSHTTHFWCHTMKSRKCPYPFV